jgi:hypothetical protein
MAMVPPRLGVIRDAPGHLQAGRYSPGGWFSAVRRPSACRGPGAGRAPGRVRSAAAAVRVAGGHQRGDGSLAGLDVPLQGGQPLVTADGHQQGGAGTRSDLQAALSCQGSAAEDSTGMCTAELRPAAAPGRRWPTTSGSLAGRHGASDPAPAGDVAERQIADVVAVIGENAGVRCAWPGTAGAACWPQLLAVRHPGLTSGLVLADPAQVLMTPRFPAR